MVRLVRDDERVVADPAGPARTGLGDARVGDRDPVEVPRRRRVLGAGLEVQAGGAGDRRPLARQRAGRADDDDTPHATGRELLTRELDRRARLPGARGGGDQERAALPRAHRHERPLLPPPQAGGAGGGETAEARTRHPARRAGRTPVSRGTTASASISTSIRGSISAATWTIDVTGGSSPKASPCARATSSQREMSVTYIRVRTTSAGPAPTRASAATMFAERLPRLRARIADPRDRAVIHRRRRPRHEHALTRAHHAAVPGHRLPRRAGPDAARSASLRPACRTAGLSLQRGGAPA